ncbi:MAG: 30S ribosomal protein S6 [Patescibacteria group bacterium]|nr:30S ribosomal protein S6 [Patescibacteria group bacterium]
MTNYELALILSSELTNPEIEKKLTHIRKSLEKIGKIDKEDIWGMRDFAYRIKFQHRGYYAIFYVSAEAGMLSELDSELRLDNDVLRHLITVHDVNYVPVVRLEEEGARVDKREARVKAKTEVIIEETAVDQTDKKVKTIIPEPEAPDNVEPPKSQLDTAELEPEKTIKKRVKIVEEEPKIPVDGVARKKTQEKKKSSLTDLDAALDALLKD